MPKIPKQTLFDKVVGVVMPVVIIAIFFLGIPLGYKLVIGDRKSALEKGTIQQITLIHEIDGQRLDGRPAKIVAGYVVVELSSGRSLWIPEENVAGIEFRKTD